MKLRLTILAIFSILACQKEKPAARLSAQTMSDITLVPVRPTPQLLANDNNFISFLNSGIRLLNGVTNKTLPAMIEGTTITTAQYVAIVRKMNFADTTAFQLFWLNFRFQYAMLTKAYGKDIPASVMDKAIDVLNADMAGSTDKCRLGYDNCVIDVKKDFNKTMWACFVGGLTGAAAFTPIGGGAILVGCGATAIYNSTLSMTQCANNWNICLAEYQYSDEELPKLVPRALFLKMIPL